MIIHHLNNVPTKNSMHKHQCTCGGSLDTFVTYRNRTMKPTLATMTAIYVFLITISALWMWNTRSQIVDQQSAVSPIKPKNCTLDKSPDVLHRLEQAIRNAWTAQNFDDDRQLLSRRLNTLFMELNQLICDLNDGKTSTGSWCMSYFQRGHVTDSNLAAAMSVMLQGRTVASFGDGPGNYRQLILKSGLVQVFDSFDGSPMIEKVTSGNVQFLDLTIPQYGLSLYDWVISLEVIEHIPAQYEDTVLSNLVRHAKNGLILSWARPRQGGMGHVNEQSDEYAMAKLKSLCFERDMEKSELLRNAAKTSWLKSNTYVYLRRENCTANPGEA